MAILTGVLKVNDRVTLTHDQGTIEVITLPLQTSIGWEAIVAQAVNTFKPWDGERVTLEGDLHGGLLVSARMFTPIELPAGRYVGSVESETGRRLRIEVRFEPDANVASADFFLSDEYIASLRAALSKVNGDFTGNAPRVIFDWEKVSHLGGSFLLRPQNNNTFQVECLLPEPTPLRYTGSVSFTSPYFRSLNIEVDKLDGLPWPPRLSTADIPLDQQLPGLETQELSVDALFKKAGIDTHVRCNDGALDSTIGSRAGRPAEEDRWDEREMHEMMAAFYSRSLSEREWWIYLLVVTRFDGGPWYEDGGFVTDENGNIRNGGEGTMGIIFDSESGAIGDPWTPWVERVMPQFRHLFDHGRPGSFQNIRARQGSAVFWREFLDFFGTQPQWDRDRRFLRTIVHELGHALNLAHTWLVNRVDSTSFMQYPQRYPHGESLQEKDRNYWLNFDYQFDPEEIFHFHHGFYNEVIPGGSMEFMHWTPSSVFKEPTAGGTRANISLQVTPTKNDFRFAEPVLFNVSVANNSPTQIPIGNLSPAYGNVRYMLKHPNGTFTEYIPPLYKCEISREPLLGAGKKSHTTSLTVGAKGFTFDAPGRYEIAAALPDPSTGAVILSPPVSFWIRYPVENDEEIALNIFDRDPGLFLYMAGGEHLAKAKGVLEETSDKYPQHPFSAHANLALGLNALAGQKRPPNKTVTKSNPKAAMQFFNSAIESGYLPDELTTRLNETIALSQPKSRHSTKGKA